MRCGFRGGSDGEESACKVGNLGLTPGSGRSPERGHGNPLQYSCLENPRGRGAWRATVHGVAKSWTRLNAASAAAAKSLQSCPTLSDPIDGSPPGSPVPGILQASTGVGCHFLLQCMHACMLSRFCRVRLCDPMDGSPPGSSVYRILQARTLEWVAISFSTRLSD